MPSVSVFNLSPGTTLAAGDLLVLCDISDTTQSANGSDLNITITNFFATVPVPIVVTSASANALAVGRLGATTPAFQVDASTASQVAGLKVTGAATGGSVAVVVTDSGSNASLTINAKGTGTIGIGSVSTGAVTITPATTVTGALTANGGIVVAAAQTITGTVGSSTISGFLSVTATTFVGALTGSISGNAATATALQTARAINGVNFDGTAAITVTAAAGTLTGTTLNATVVTTSITAVGTITTGVWNAGAVTSSGAISGTTGAFSGNLTVGSSTFVVTAATGAFTSSAHTLNAVGNTHSISYAATSVGTGYQYGTWSNTGAAMIWGIESSVGGALFGGSTAYASVWGTNNATPVHLSVNNTVKFTLAGDGLSATLGTPLAITGALTGVTTLAASGIISASRQIQLANATATPAGLVDGQLWYDGTNLRCRLGGATKTVTVA